MSKIKLPLVSIVIPMYKSRPYYKGCLNSGLKSEYPNSEVILVIDGEDNDTAYLVQGEFGRNKKFLQTFAKILFLISIPLSIMASFVLLQSARGEVLCVVAEK